MSGHASFGPLSSRSSWLAVALISFAACDGCESDPQQQGGGTEDGGKGGGGGSGAAEDGGASVGGMGGGGMGGGPVGAAPSWPLTAGIRIIDATASSFSVRWGEATDDVAVTGYELRIDGVGADTVPGDTLEYTVTAVAIGELHRIEVVAVDADAQAAVGPSIHGMAVPDEPVAPPLDPGVPFSIQNGTRFLIGPEGPVQLDLDPGALDDKRIAVVRGRVLQDGGDPLPGVEVEVQGQPQLGRAISRADGRFDMLVNGGGQLFLQFRHPDHLPSSRTIQPRWEDWSHVEDVVLLQRDPNATLLELSEGGVARGSVIQDQDGMRQARVFIPAGTEALLRMPDGSTQPIESLTLRITEFTVGELGPAAMPASLPCYSAYTYAVAVTADEADALGGQVEFATPISLNVDNFLNIPVGGGVPVGEYKPEGYDPGPEFRSFHPTWVAGAGGTVVEVISEDPDGTAHVDTDGDGNADDLGFEDEELKEIGAEFDPGDELSRIPLDNLPIVDPNHARFYEENTPDDLFDPNSLDPTTWDGVPSVSGPGSGGPDGCSSPGGGEKSEPCEAGTKISVEPQSLGEALPVAGTPYYLHYESSRVLGRKGLFELDIPISGETVPGLLLGVAVDVSVAGRLESFLLPAPGPNVTHHFSWDGEDAWGRRALGRLPVEVNIDYIFEARYIVGQEGLFAFPATTVGAQLAAGRDIAPLTSSKRWRGSLGAPGGLALGLEGWSLSDVHVFDRNGGRVYFGDGTYRDVGATGWIVNTAAGTGSSVFSSIPGPALEASFFLGSDVEALPDGSFLIAESFPAHVLKVDAAGQISIVAGNGQGGYSGDGGLAVDAKIGEPRSVAAAPDGSFVIATGSGCRLRRVGVDGVVSTLAGTGVCNGDSVEGAQANVTPFGNLEDVAIGCDGAIWTVEMEANRIRRIDPSGETRTIIGGPVRGFAGDGGPADQALIDGPSGILVTDRCGVVFADSNNHRIRVINDAGMVRTIAGNGGNARTEPLVGEGGPATSANLGNYLRLALMPSGAILVADSFTGRILSIGTDGILRRFAGSRVGGSDFEDRPALDAPLSPLGGISVMPDGTVLSGSGTRVLKIGRVPHNRLPEGLTPIPSLDSRAVWIFDRDGRHLRTVDGISGETLLELGYEDGWLSTLTAYGGETTTVQRDPNGAPTAIVAATGQITTLQTDGASNLVEVTNPQAQSYSFEYAPGSLMTEMLDPEGNQWTFSYDEQGLLLSDTGPTGQSLTLTRSSVSPTETRVDATTTMGKVTSYFLEVTADSIRRRFLDPAGAASQFIVDRDGTEHKLYADGSGALRRLGPDPRWGMMAPIAELVSFTTPGGITTSRAVSRTVSLDTPGDPLSLLAAQDVITDSVGASRVKTLDAAGYALSDQPPEGPATAVSYRADGQVLLLRPDPGFDGDSFAYDPAGRLIAFTQAGVTREWSFDAAGMPVFMTNGTADVWTRTWSPAGRLLTLLEPTGGSLAIVYDDVGWLAGIDPPVMGPMSIVRDALGRPTSFTPSAPSGSVQFTYDADGDPQTITAASGKEIDFTFDAAGRVIAIVDPDGQTNMTYSDPTSRIQSATRDLGTGRSHSLSYAYDGPLVTQAQWDGPQLATVNYLYGAEARLVSRSFSSGADSETTLYGYRSDGLMSSMGSFAIERNGPAASPSQYSDGALQLTLAYHPTSRLAQRSNVVASTTVYSIEPTFDGEAQVISLQETADGVTVNRTFERDAAGRVISMSEDGVPLASYGWDLAGNPISRQLASGPLQIATVDGQGRLTSLGGVSYGWDADGALASRGGDVFTYSVAGELLEATVGAQTVTYGYDAYRRRTSRTGSTGTARYYYADQDEPFRVTHVRREDGGLDVLHYDGANILMAIDRDGTRLYIASDFVGSPRLVVDAGGAVLREIQYGPFGEILMDTQPSVDLSIGFAGGLADPLTGLVRFGLRDYDPASGRFTTRDPARLAGESYNLYAYVGSDPVSFVDVTGLWELGGSAYAGLGGGGSVAYKDGRLSVCAELGIGAGTSLDFDPSAAAETGSYWETTAEIKGSAGPLAASLSLSRKDGCEPVVKGELAAGPLKYDGEKVKIGLLKEELLFKATGLKLEAKMVRRYCTNVL